MKNIFNTTLFKKIGTTAMCTALILTSSCKKFTDLQPLDALSTVTAFSTVANVELAAAGVYNSASVGTYNGGAGRGYAFGAASIEQGEARGEDVVNLAAFYQITYEATYDATTANNVNMWVNLYQLANQANVFIEGVKNARSSGVLTSTAALAYEGEARFLRALAHHELLIHFSRPFAENNGGSLGVPYRDIAITNQEAVDAASSLARGTVRETYTKILADLDFAEANLPITRSGLRYIRATAGAAIALKTRIKLHMNDWAGVITEGVKLGATGNGPFASPAAVGVYSLTASPDGPFLGFGKTVNNESMFSIENSTLANPGVNGSLPGMLSASTINGVTAGRGLVATSPNLYNASFWVTGDTRRSLLQVQQSLTTARYFFNNKYRDYTNQTDNAPIIRYAEVLLNVAEANARITPSSPQALALLNAVRNRAVPVTEQYNAVTAPIGNALIQAILNERRIEFACEGRRWADIHRLSLDANFAVVPGGGIPAKVLVGSLTANGANYDVVTRPVTLSTLQAVPYSNAKFLWPIPQSEVAANPVLAAQQNPGY